MDAFAEAPLDGRGRFVRLEDLAKLVRKLEIRNHREYKVFVAAEVDTRMPPDPEAAYGKEKFEAFGGWDALILGKTTSPPNAPVTRPEPVPAPPVLAIPAPPPEPPPVVEKPPAAPVVLPEPEAPIPLPLGPKPSVLTGRPKRPRPLPVEVPYEEPPPPTAKKPPPAPKKPATPKLRRDDLESEEAKRVYDMFRCITGDWDD